MKKQLGKFLNQLLGRLGYTLVKADGALLKNRLQNMARLGFEAPVILDGGAHKGNWTKMVSKIFPDSKYILVEPNPTVFSKIRENLKGQDLEYTVVEKALGATSGHLELNIWEDADKELTGSSLCTHVRGTATKTLRCEVAPLDTLIDVYNETPNLVKLDLQGYEINALKGAEKILRSAELLIIEFGCLEAYIDRTSVDELMDFLYERDYRLYDIVDLHYRPYDKALTGGDFFFIKKNSKLRAYSGWE
ncbi:FkbM family methyltransferase [Sungkyunkwania multivorans]|uniref:FkbM family methyltransferase n=1 Tax=Sungkyunkwania multivorans TaxID=1173618 RepID=A0ABW3CZG8_9FLAO